MAIHKLQSYSLSASKKEGSMRLSWKEMQCHRLPAVVLTSQFNFQCQDYFDFTCPLLFMYQTGCREDNETTQIQFLLLPSTKEQPHISASCRFFHGITYILPHMELENSYYEDALLSLHPILLNNPFCTFELMEPTFIFCCSQVSFMHTSMCLATFPKVWKLHKNYDHNIFPFILSCR